MKKLNALDYLFAILVTGFQLANPFLFIGIAGLCGEYDLPFGLVYPGTILLTPVAFLGLCKIKI